MREPGWSPARQSGDMPTRTHGPDAGSHDTHDRLLVAARAAGDIAGPELDRADALLAACEACRVLHAELLAIAAATHHLPAPVRPPAIDFRISPDRASDLARGGLWRQLLRPFGRSGSPAIRPLAAAFTTLGLAGLMLAALPNLQLGSAGSGDLTTIGQSIETPNLASASAAPEMAAPGDRPTLVPSVRDTAGQVDAGGNLGPLASADRAGPMPSVASTKGRGIATASPETAADRLAFAVSDGDGGPPPLVRLSLGLLAIGLGLFLLRRVALRLR